MRVKTKLALARRSKGELPRVRRPRRKIEDPRLSWLLEFLHRDIATMRPGELLDLRNDVFTYLHGPTMATKSVDDPDHAALRPARAEESDPTVGLARALLQRVQRELRDGAEVFERTGQWWPFGITPDRPGPQWVLERRPDGTIARYYYGAWNTITVASAVDLLAQWWPRLRRCAYRPCNRLFLPGEIGQRERYHDKKCSALARWHRLPPRDHKTELVRRVLRNGPGRGRGRKKR